MMSNNNSGIFIVNNNINDVFFGYAMTLANNAIRTLRENFNQNFIRLNKDTYKQAVAHLPEINRPTGVEVHFWIDFYFY